MSNDFADLVRMTMRAIGCPIVTHRRLVSFRGHKLILMGTLKEGGPLVFQLPEEWEQSFAHLYQDGEIKRFGKVIGHRKDLKLLARSVAV